MDCKNARLLLEFTHPGSAELDRDDAEALHQHLADCPDCAAQAREERRADEHLGRALRAVPVPAGLRERLLKRLSDDHDASSRRRLLRWAGGGAAAAAVLAAVLLGYHTWFGQLPAVNGNDLHAQANSQPRSQPQTVEENFQSMGVAMKAPPRFDYSYLDSYGLVAFQGQQVPQLLFVLRAERTGPPALARVYVLSSRQFDLQQTRKNGVTFPGSTYRVELEDFGDPNYLYAIVFSGESLRSFYKENDLR